MATPLCATGRNIGVPEGWLKLETGFHRKGLRCPPKKREEKVMAAAEGRLLDLIVRDSWRHDHGACSKALVSAHYSKDIDLHTLLPLPDPFPYSNHRD